MERVGATPAASAAGHGGTLSKLVSFIVCIQGMLPSSTKDGAGTVVQCVVALML